MKICCHTPCPHHNYLTTYSTFITLHKFLTQNCKIILVEAKCVTTKRESRPSFLTSNLTFSYSSCFCKTFPTIKFLNLFNNIPNIKQTPPNHLWYNDFSQQNWRVVNFLLQLLTYNLDLVIDAYHHSWTIQYQKLSGILKNVKHKIINIVAWLDIFPWLPWAFSNHYFLLQPT